MEHPVFGDFKWLVNQALGLAMKFKKSDPFQISAELDKHGFRAGSLFTICLKQTNSKMMPTSLKSLVQLGPN